jgi:Uma2 family endonuclease
MSGSGRESIVPGACTYRAATRLRSARSKDWKSIKPNACGRPGEFLPRFLRANPGEERIAIMATVPKQRRTREVRYPTRDGKPMGETELHINELIDAFHLLKDFFAGQPNVYVGGNLLLYYEEGNRRKRVSPDVLVALDVPGKPKRDYYLVWKEGKAPDFIIEITSKSTRREDQKKKLVLYRDVLRVSEYFLFDPRGDYLNPPLQGFRLAGGDYVPIEPIAGRLPSQVLGLHLERDGENLRLFDPTTGKRLLTRLEGRAAAERLAGQERERTESERQRADQERQIAQAAEAARQSLTDEVERLRREIEALRGR